MNIKEMSKSKLWLVSPILMIACLIWNLCMTIDTYRNRNKSLIQLYNVLEIHHEIKTYRDSVLIDKLTPKGVR